MCDMPNLHFLIFRCKLSSFSFWRTCSVKVVVRGGDEEIIHVDNEPSFGDHVFEQIIHESLEGGGGVA